MDLREFFDLILRRARVLVLCLLVGGVVGLAVGVGPTSYLATAVVSVRPVPASADPYGIQTAVTLETYATLASSPAVAAAALRAADVDESPGQLAGSTSARPVTSTYLIDVTVAARQPGTAVRLATAVADVLGDQIRRGAVGRSVGKDQTVGLSGVQPAGGAAAAGSVSRLSQAIHDALYGLAAGLAAVVVIELAGDSVRSIRQLERRSGLAVLGSVPGPPTASETAVGRALLWLIGESRPRPETGDYQRAFALLRRGVQSALPAGVPGVVLVTSVAGGEGRTFVASGLADSFAEHGWKVVGVSYPAAPARLLVDAGADVAVVDGPPVLPGSAALDMAVSANAVVIVVERGVTRWSRLRRSLDLLARNHAPVAGVVLNRDEPDRPRPLRWVHFPGEHRSVRRPVAGPPGTTAAASAPGTPVTATATAHPAPGTPTSGTPSPDATPGADAPTRAARSS